LLACSSIEQLIARSSVKQRIACLLAEQQIARLLPERRRIACSVSATTTGCLLLLCLLEKPRRQTPLHIPEKETNGFGGGLFACLNLEQKNRETTWLDILELSQISCIIEKRNHTSC
jgi:hypothetical protein